MKTSTTGIVLVAILVVAAGVGVGIAQAAGNHSDRPVLSFEDQEALGQDSPSDGDSAIVKAEGDTYWDAQMAGPIETGRVPGRSDVGDLDHSDFPIEGNVHQYWGADNPSN
jgi:hypothetical protein